jgi:hypothetical protein
MTTPSPLLLTIRDCVAQPQRWASRERRAADPAHAERVREVWRQAYYKQRELHPERFPRPDPRTHPWPKCQVCGCKHQSPTYRECKA